MCNCMCVVCPHGYEHLLKPEEDVGAARGGISDSCESPNKYVGNQTERSSRSSLHAILSKSISLYTLLLQNN